MLPSSLFDWWFAPWSYAVNPNLHLPLASDRFAQRDGYRLWCAKAQVDPDFPTKFHAAWHIAVTSDTAYLCATARLFGGLIAAREHDQLRLGMLSTMDRKWCLGIAATQPLQRCQKVQYEDNDSIEVCGLGEIAHRLQAGFPGMWSRLRLLLMPEHVIRVDAFLTQALDAPVESDAAHLRAQRCWRICRDKVDAREISLNARDTFTTVPSAIRPDYRQTAIEVDGAGK